MKTIIICKDCLSQFESTNQHDSLNLIKNTPTANSQVSVFFTECVGICPADKISVIELNKGIVNSMKSKSLSLNEISKMVNYMNIK